MVVVVVPGHYKAAVGGGGNAGLGLAVVGRSGYLELSALGYAVIGKKLCVHVNITGVLVV